MSARYIIFCKQIAFESACSIYHCHQMGPVPARCICPRLQHITSSEWFLPERDTRNISTQIIVQFIFLCSIAYTFFFSDPVEQRRGESTGAGAGAGGG